MPCSECTERARLLAASEQLLAEKRVKYARTMAGMPERRERLLGSYESAVRQARENLDRHRKECEAANG